VLPPSGNDLIEMLEDYLTHFAQTWRAVILEILGNIETVWMQPILAFCISLQCVHMSQPKGHPVAAQINASEPRASASGIQAGYSA
jgi:hypothetical protein